MNFHICFEICFAKVAVVWSMVFSIQSLGIIWENLGSSGLSWASGIRWKDLEPGKWVQIGDWMNAEVAQSLIVEAIARGKDA